MSRIGTRGLHDTHETDLGSHMPKSTAVHGLTEASLTVWTSDVIETGLWECTTGSFAATREGYTEICTFLSGRVSIEVKGQEPEEFGPGDILITPSGWEGTWHVHEPVRKHFTIIHDQTQPQSDPSSLRSEGERS